MRKIYFIILLIIFAMTGCVSRQVYDSFQYGRKNKCMQLPESQYRECMENANKSYDEYERARKEALDK